MIIKPPFSIPENIFLYDNIARTYFAQGDLSQAIRFDEKGAEQEPDNYYWPFQIAKIYEEQGNKNGALSYPLSLKD